MQRIQASPASAIAELEKNPGERGVSTADRPSRLLRFLVQETVEGRADSLKEYTLGTSILGRKPPSIEDRSHCARGGLTPARSAGPLLRHGRKNRPGGDQSPKGGYVPVFEMNEPDAAIPAALPLPPPRSRLSWRWIAAMGVVLAIAGAGTFTLLHPRLQPVLSLRLSVVLRPTRPLNPLRYPRMAHALW